MSEELENQVETTASEEVIEEVSAQQSENEEIMQSVMHDPDAPIITMKKLLEAGAHFGHPTKRWNPKMKKYIYGSRNGVYIIDLSKTVECITTAYLALKDIVDKGGKVLFVGTKKQCQEAVEAEALRSGSFYITNRWLGGTLTNFKTIQNRIRYLKELERKDEDGELDLLNKKEAAVLRKEKDKLNKNLIGIKEMRKVPNAVFIVDPHSENIAIKEAHKLHIPVFGIVDTNSDPDEIDYPIPANDDAIRSVALILAVMADAIVESKAGIPVVAYTKDEGDEVTMKDAIKQADKENQEKLARIRAERKARQEKIEKEQQERAKARAAREAEDKKIEEASASKPKRTRKPKTAAVEETKVEETTPVVEEVVTPTSSEEEKGE